MCVSFSIFLFLFLLATKEREEEDWIELIYLVLSSLCFILLGRRRVSDKKDRRLRAPCVVGCGVISSSEPERDLKRERENRTDDCYFF